MSNSENITGIILAGGKSSRMGSHKGLVSYKGKPMISYSIDLLTSQCSRIILSSSLDVYDNFGLERVADSYGDAGPMGGLLSALHKSETRLNICLPCDTPNIPPEALVYMIKLAQNDICIIPLTQVTNNEGFESLLPEPLIGIYPLGVIPVLEQLISKKEYSMKRIFDYYPTHFVSPDELPMINKSGIFSNINTLKDLD